MSPQINLYTTVQKFTDEEAAEASAQIREAIQKMEAQAPKLDDSARERQLEMALELAMPYGSVCRCNNLQGIYGADMYAPTAVQVLRDENAYLRIRIKVYQAVALVGWAGVVGLAVLFL